MKTALLAIWTYFFNLGVAIDQVGNTLLAGAPDETLSARAWRGEQNKRIAGRIFRPVIDGMFSPFQKEHCRKSHESEMHRRQLPRAYQTTARP